MVVERGWRGEWSRRKPDGKCESMFVCAIWVGAADCLDWVVREVDATAVTSVQCQIAEPKSRTCAFEQGSGPSLPQPRPTDSCCSDSLLLGGPLTSNMRSIPSRRLNPQPTAAVDFLRTTMVIAC